LTTPLAIFDPRGGRGQGEFPAGRPPRGPAHRTGEASRSSLM